MRLLTAIRFLTTPLYTESAASMRRLTLLAGFALVGLSACSSDSTSSATTAADSVPATDAPTVDTTDTTVVEETVVEETVVEETMVDDTEPTGSGEGDGTEFCDINTELDNDDLAMDGSDTPEEIEEYFTVIMPAQLERLVGVTPPELAADVATLVEGVTLFGDVLGDNDWNLEAAYADPALTALITDPEFDAAGTRVDEYCGV